MYAVRSILFLTLMLAVPAAASNTVVEDFDTRVRADTMATTAVWDTVALELRMPAYLRDLSQWPTPDAALHVAVSGDYAFVAMDQAGLWVFDVSDPTAPVWVDSVVTTEQILEVVIRGDYAYLANNFAGLYLFDVSNPTAPAYVSDRITIGQTQGIDVAGHYAYLADGPRGLTVIDVRDPHNPVQVGSYDAPIQGLSVRVAGRYAYLADWINGLAVIDIADPTDPVEVARLDTPGISRGLAVHGNRLYSADGSPGLHVIDITNPLAPAFVNTIDTGFARGVTPLGPFIYIADASLGLRAYEVSAPAAPLLLSSVEPGGNYQWTAPWGQFGFGAAGAGGFHSLRLAHPADSLVSEFEIPVAGASGALAFDGLQVWVGSTAGVTGVDIADPHNPLALGSHATAGSVVSAAAGGDVLMLGVDAAPSIEFVDLTLPASPVSHATLSPQPACGGVAMDGALGFAACGAWLYTLDISDVTAPAIAGSLSVGGVAVGIHVDGRWVYIADGTAAGFSVADVTHLDLPTAVGGFATSGAAAAAITVEGDVALLALGDGTLVTVDVTDPSAPAELGRAQAPGSLRSVAVEGDRVMAAGSAGLSLFDITDALNPSLVGTAPTSGSALGAYAWGDHVLVVNDGAGLEGVRQYRRRTAPGLARAQSLTIAGGSADILRARLLTQEQGVTDWSVTANGGSNWTSVEPDNTWAVVSQGSDLRWRVDLDHDLEATAVSEVRVEWLVAAASICSVTDWPEDQGGGVRVEWRRSGHDFASATDPVTEYVVQRYQPVTASWDSVRAVPASEGELYVTRIPGSGDATAVDTVYTTARVLARTGSGAAWISAPDSGYSVDNLAPGAPQDVEVAYNGAGNHVAWAAPPDPDVAGYRVYRDLLPVPGPDPALLVHETVNTFWSDAVADGGQYFYIVTALDAAPNESAAASATTVSSVRPGPGPPRFALLPNVPNPFNPDTMIRFDVPAATVVALRVFDVRGRLVRTLQDATVPRGRQQVRWDGRNDRGQPVASGVYFVRMTAQGFAATRKVTLVQ